MALNGHPTLRFSNKPEVPPGLGAAATGAPCLLSAARGRKRGTNWARQIEEYGGPGSGGRAHGDGQWPPSGPRNLAAPLQTRQTTCYA